MTLVVINRYISPASILLQLILLLLEVVLAGPNLPSQLSLAQRTQELILHLGDHVVGLHRPVDQHHLVVVAEPVVAPVLAAVGVGGFVLEELVQLVGQLLAVVEDETCLDGEEDPE